jgi:hypothetical protein
MDTLSLRSLSAITGRPTGLLSCMLFSPIF